MASAYTFKMELWSPIILFLIGSLKVTKFLHTLSLNGILFSHRSSTTVAQSWVHNSEKNKPFSFMRLITSGMYRSVSPPTDIPPLTDTT